MSVYFCKLNFLHIELFGAIVIFSFFLSYKKGHGCFHFQLFSILLFAKTSMLCIQCMLSKDQSAQYKKYQVKSLICLAEHKDVERPFGGIVLVLCESQ